MLDYVKFFLEEEKNKKSVILKTYPNGIEYVFEEYKGFNYLHSFYYPLNDAQIDKLQQDVNIVQEANYQFPQWYRDFLKTTNGLNIFFDSLRFSGEQTPIVNHPKYGLTEAFIERDNPNWIAPYNLRYSRSTKYDHNAQNRWLTIGSYFADGTCIAWDFKVEKIVLMYVFPITMPIKVWKKLKEDDYEKQIFQTYDNFNEFFLSETKRLNQIFSELNKKHEIDRTDIMFWRRTLPVRHKDYQE